MGRAIVLAVDHLPEYAIDNVIDIGWKCIDENVYYIRHIRTDWCLGQLLALFDPINQPQDLFLILNFEFWNVTYYGKLISITLGISSNQLCEGSD